MAKLNIIILWSGVFSCYSPNGLAHQNTALHISISAHPMYLQYTVCSPAALRVGSMVTPFQVTSALIAVE